MNININLARTNNSKYKNISKDTISFINLFNNYISSNNIEPKYDDFIYSLKTHLLMINYSTVDIKNYLEDVVIKNSIDSVN